MPTRSHPIACCRQVVPSRSAPVAPCVPLPRRIDGKTGWDGVVRFMTTLNTATRYEELLAPDVPSDTYDYSTLFAAKGWLARRRAKRRFKLLRNIDAKLSTVLHPDERVFFATTGTTATFGEQFFVGWVALYLNRRALVFTTERVLLIQITSRNRPAQLLSQIRYEQVARVKSTWTGTCAVALQNGPTLKFQHVPKADRKFLQTFLADIVKSTTADNGEGGRVEHLCPKCHVVVPGHPSTCPACEAPFKSPRTAYLRSLLFPGLGDWYLGHRGFAAFEMLGSALFWSLLVVVPLVNGGMTDPDTQEFIPNTGATWITAGIVLGLMHLFDAIITRHFARKGHHPA